MRCFIRSLVLLAILLISIVGSLSGEKPQVPNCTVAPITATRLRNIFSPAQEVELGEVLADTIRSSSYEIDDPELTGYLQNIGDNLVKHLPPSDLKFRFYLSNLPEANAFSIAGGRIYVSRKLIGFARSEDELAGVLAHEIGHIVTHQSAIDFTRLFAKAGITEVKDREDIAEKFHRALESHKTIYSEEEERQLEADRTGLELVAFSGYRVDGVADFYDRLTNNKGKTGNWFTDFFRSGSVDTKRFREMQKTLRTLPAGCGSPEHATTDSQFKQWRSAVVAYGGTGRREQVPGLKTKRTLDPPLQEEVHTLRFSYDGRFLLAQDEGSIYLLSRAPLAVKFRIEAPEAYPAQFTLDSKRLTFYTPELRVEVWDVEKGKRDETYELSNYRGCYQTALSPDGHFLACVDSTNTLTIFDTSSGDRILEKKDIRAGDLSVNEGLESYRVSYEIRYLNIGFSLDGRYFLLGGSGDSNFAFDLQTRHEVPISGNLRPFLRGAFAFIAPDRLVGVDKSGSRSAIFSFPEGRLERLVETGAAVPARVAKGDAILLRPIKDFAVGVLDIKTNSIIRASKTPALDLYGDVVANTLGSGEVAMFGSSSAAPIAKVQLPRGHLGRVRAFDLSSDASHLAVSTGTRGSVWDLNTGKRLYNLKNFRGACFAKDSALYVDFPKRDNNDRAIVRINLQPPGMTLVQKLEKGLSWQEGSYLLTLKSGQKNEEKDEEEKRDFRYEGTKLSWNDVLLSESRSGTLEVRDISSGALLWSKKFDRSIPRIYSEPTNGLIAFRWDLLAEGARGELKDVENSLPSSAKPDPNDYLVRLYDIATGRPAGGIVLGTHDAAYEFEHNLTMNSDWLAADDSFGRTLVYSLKTGSQVGRAFGKPRLIAPHGNLLVVEQVSGQLSLYSLPGMQKVRELSFPYNISGGTFSQDGRELWILTSDQVLYSIDVGRQIPSAVSAALDAKPAQ